MVFIKLAHEALEHGWPSMWPLVEKQEIKQAF